MANPVIGIDLGTTNSEVAYVFEDKPCVITLDNNGVGGKGILPSAVGVDGKGDLIVGDAARNQALVFPENTILGVKRKMGEAVYLSLGGKSYSPRKFLP